LGVITFILHDELEFLIRHLSRKEFGDKQGRLSKFANKAFQEYILKNYTEEELKKLTNF
jgi:hypothetical protein